MSIIVVMIMIMTLMLRQSLCSFTWRLTWTGLNYSLIQQQEVRGGLLLVVDKRYQSNEVNSVRETQSFPF